MRFPIFRESPPAAWLAGFLMLATFYIRVP
jgi:hypothetical protein